jgi:hypothetical protein
MSWGRRVPPWTIGIYRGDVKFHRGSSRDVVGHQVHHGPSRDAEGDVESHYRSSRDALRTSSRTLDQREILQGCQVAL